MKKISLSVAAGILALIIIFFGFSLAEISEGQEGVLNNNAGFRVLAPGLHLVWPWQQLRVVAVNNQMSSFAISLPGGTESLQLAVLWNVSDINSFAKANDTSNEVMNLLSVETTKIMTPSFLPTAIIPANLSASILKALQTDTTLQGKGIVVSQVWVKNIVPNSDTQAKIFANMKGLAATIGESIIQSGEAQAEQVRNTAEQSFLQAQSAALAQAAAIVGQGNSAAVKIMAPMYRQNPALFKAYVAAKVKLLSKNSSS